MNCLTSSALIFVSAIGIAAGSPTESYVSGAVPFVLIEDVNRQAEAWATCAAVYDLSAEILGSTPAQAKRLKELGNGASMAVTMTHVSDGLDSGITSERFAALWNYSKVLGKALPEAQMTAILADAEVLGKKGAAEFMNKLTASMKVCMENSEGQRVYIDAWRELAKSGLLKSSKDQ